MKSNGPVSVGMSHEVRMMRHYGKITRHEEEYFPKMRGESDENYYTIHTYVGYLH